MKGIDGVSRVIGPDEPLPKFETHQALLSLPAVLKTTLSALPACVPYLKPDANRLEQWKDRIQVDPGKKKVGLVFAGRPLPDPNRSCTLAELAPLADASQVTFFSLQLGEAAEQLKSSPTRMQIIDLHENIRDFADTAAVIANLDLLMSIDTAAAHIGGALGVPTWTMLPHIADFRWMLNRPDSPWYPTMRLYRQTRQGDWSNVVSALRQDLINF
jgi:ADP-heptose:LPS heptosyltransferase